MSRNQELQRYDRPSPLAAYGALGAKDSHVNAAAGSSDLGQVFKKIRHRYRIVLAVTAAIFVLIVAGLAVLPPVYETTARVSVDPPGSEAFSLIGAMGGTSEPDYVETQAHVLRSTALTLQVIRQNRLDESPVITKKSFFARQMDRLHVLDLKKLLHPAAAHHASTPDATHLSPAEAVAVEFIAAHMNVAPVKNSRMIEVKFRSEDPEFAATVANSVMQNFVTSNYSARFDAVMKSSEWLSRQLDDIRRKADAANAELARYQKQFGIADIDGTQSTLSERERALIAQFTGAQAERIQLESTIMRIRGGDAQSLPQFRDNALTQTVLSKLMELRGSLATVSVNYGANHPEVIKLKGEIAEFENQLNGQRDSVIAELQTAFTAAQTREAQLKQQLDRETVQMTQASHYVVLRREAQASEDLYNALYAKVKEAGISAASKSSNIRVIDPAIVPTIASWPRLSLLLPIGFLVACIGGIAAGLLRDAIDPSIRTPEDVKAIATAPNLVLVPQFKQARLESSGSVPEFGHPLASGDQQIDLFLLNRSDSPESESVRSLLGSILLAKGERRVKVILVASPFPREGKTTLAYNLAAGLAQKGRTCLIDADLRKGSVGASHPGVAEYCRGEANVAQVQVTSPDLPNLAYTPTGKVVSSPTEVLMSHRFQELVDAMRKDKEFVVIDSPPMLPYADARFLAALSDGVVMVAMAGSTDRRSLDSAFQMMNGLSVPVLALALNGVNTSHLPFQGYYPKPVDARA